MELNWKGGGGGSSNKKPPSGEVWIFSETTQFSIFDVDENRSLHVICCTGVTGDY